MERTTWGGGLKGQSPPVKQNKNSFKFFFAIQKFVSIFLADLSFHMLFLFHQRIIYNWKGIIKCTNHGTEFSVFGNETTSLNNLLHNSLF